MKTQANLHDHVLSTLSTEIRTTPSLTVEQIAQYHRDKYVIIRKLFDLEDIEPFRKACDPDMQGVQAKINDKAGGYFKVALWSELGDILLYHFTKHLIQMMVSNSFLPCSPAPLPPYCLFVSTLK